MSLFGLLSLSRNESRSWLTSQIGLGRFLLDVALSGLSFLLAMLLRLGWSAIERGSMLLTNLLFFSGVCATVYLLTGLSIRSWRFVDGGLPFRLGDLPRADLLIVEPVRLLACGATAETDVFLRSLQSETRGACHGRQP